jgi:hypothetical protein
VIAFMNATAQEHAEGWLAAWNAHDLDAIIDFYAEEVEFTAPTVIARWNRPDGRLNNREELRRHFARGLEMVPNLTFTREALLETPGGYALFYRRENGNRVADVVELDDSGKAIRVKAYYEHAQA